MNHLIRITKSDGTTQLFEEEKLVHSLKKAGALPEAIDEIVDEILSVLAGFEGIEHFHSGMKQA